MNHTRTALTLAALVLILATSVSATGHLAYVGVFPDEDASTCLQTGEFSSLAVAYAIITNSIPLQEISFRAPVPFCLGGPAAWVYDESSFSTAGNSRDGITIDLGGCATSPVMVLKIYYFGLAQGCCAWPAYSATGSEYDDLDFVDCDGVTRPGYSTVVQPIYACCDVWDLLAPYEPFPPDSADNVPTDVTLTWLLPDEECGESIYFSDTPPTPTFAPTDIVPYFTSYTPEEPLSPNTTYYWQVRLQCGYDIGSWSDVWTFTTGDGTLPVEETTWGRIKATYGY